MVPRIYQSRIYLENNLLKRLTNNFLYFHILIILVYYLSLFILGIDGFARQCQYNYVVFLLLYIGCLNEKRNLNILNILPILYSIFTVYYTLLYDVSFSRL